MGQEPPPTASVQAAHGNPQKEPQFIMFGKGGVLSQVKQQGDSGRVQRIPSAFLPVEGSAPSCVLFAQVEIKAASLCCSSSH